MLNGDVTVAVAATRRQAPIVHGGVAMNHLRFLRYFDEVARTGSIRQAAERLHVAPSAVNRRIQDLEDELGVPLFERLPRGMRLTAAGELFVQYVRGRASALDQVRSEIEELQGPAPRQRALVRLVQRVQRDLAHLGLLCSMWLFSSSCAWSALRWMTARRILACSA
jgi:molybdenum-dependent DNA-binding transcriptional regulator ModE